MELLNNLPKWLKTLFSVLLLLSTLGLSNVYMVPIHKFFNPQENLVNTGDSLSTEKKEELFKQVAHDELEHQMQHLRDTLYKSLDSARVHFEVLYQMASRPGSEKHAVGFRSIKGNDTIWYRSTNNKEFIAHDKGDLFAKQYYDPACNCFMATRFEIPWEVYREREIAYLKRIIESP